MTSTTIKVQYRTSDPDQWYNYENGVDFQFLTNQDWDHSKSSTKLSRSELMARLANAQDLTQEAKSIEREDKTNQVMPASGFTFVRAM